MFGEAHAGLEETLMNRQDPGSLPSPVAACTVEIDRAYIRVEGGSRRHIRLALRAATAPAGRARPALRLAFVVDRSGSMTGAPLALAGRAVCEAIALLAPDDAFALVTFESDCEVAMTFGPASEQRKREAQQRALALVTGGSTNLSGGWAEGCAQVAGGAGDALARVLVLTDGQANVGETRAVVLCEHARTLRRKGVATSCLGLGAGFNETLLGAMADAGGGRFYFAERPEELIEHMRAEVLEGLDVVGRGLAVELRPHDRGRVAVLGGLESVWTGAALRVELGDLVSQQSLDAVFSVALPAGAPGEARAFDVRVVDGDGRPCGAAQTARFVYAPGEVVDRQPRAVAVDRRVARFYANDARLAALALNREGRYAEARARLVAVAERVAAYAGNDPELSGIVGELRAWADEYGRAMDEMTRKHSHSAAYFENRSKTARGRSSRGDDEV
jgi:Ca-activated chloride channel homolog